MCRSEPVAMPASAATLRTLAASMPPRRIRRRAASRAWAFHSSAVSRGRGLRGSAFTVIDLRTGGQPSLVHGVAALYLGFSVVFGKRLVAWADRMYRRKVRGEYVAEPDVGSKLRKEWVDFGLAVVAAGIAAVVLEVCVFAVGGGVETQSLRDWHPRLGKILAIWFIIGPLWVMLSPRERRSAEIG